MERAEIEKILEEGKVIAIVRGVGVNTEQALRTAHAIYDGGVRALEVPFTAKDPASDEATAATIAALVKEFDGKMLIGCGTCLNVHQVELTAQAGGTFVVTPTTNVEVIRRCVELGLAACPGALTPTEIQTAHEAGASFVKVFPVGNMGPAYIKAVRAPLGHIKMMAVGGVNEKNFEDYLKAGCVGGGFGGNLANKEWIENGEFDKITAIAKQLVEIASKY